MRELVSGRDDPVQVFPREQRVEIAVGADPRGALLPCVAMEQGRGGIVARVRKRAARRELAKTGAQIPIEERDATEVSRFSGTQTAPDGVAVYNPAFDVTPADLITAIVTERGVVRPVNEQTIAGVLSSHG